ncbi:helix-turn-helix transcriptional regulator [Paenibacillus sp. NPDC056579]|uniref:helix-turn-helix transcriptional regulator n=1 Tax=Paenibacillus sp. NPDC056579 TaxID=3345871 RepID=UPI0036C7C36B
MDIRKFGSYISKLRKENDLTQSQLADILNVTRQAVSKWELGDSFPDISLLPRLSEVFNVTVDQIINYGEPYRDENRIISLILKGTPDKVAEMLKHKELSVESVVNLAPLLKASTLGIISEGFAKHGIDIRHVVELAIYMNEEELTNLMKKASLDNLDGNMLEKFLPFIDAESKDILFTKIISGELSASLMVVLLPYLDTAKYSTLIEAAVMEGHLDITILKLLQIRDKDSLLRMR